MEGIPLDNPIKRACAWLGKIILDEMRRPMDEQTKTLKSLSDKVDRLHVNDPVAEECDLAILDNAICTVITDCRRKGYTTADERRRVTRMHDAYKARGGNHGEEREYDIFCRLPTAEEYDRA